ncbi:hypothetical protein NC651_035322 [Populus alba x Populus x berolinensis]|nr:hypothetical protein NC651_035322 [Populus alba x Populus x berolinensis]
MRLRHLFRWLMRHLEIMIERSLHTYGSGSLVASGTLASKHILEKGVAHSSPHGSKNCEPPPFATSKDAAGVELEHALIKFTSVLSLSRAKLPC